MKYLFKVDTQMTYLNFLFISLHICNKQKLCTLFAPKFKIELRKRYSSQRQSKDGFGNQSSSALNVSHIKNLTKCLQWCKKSIAKSWHTTSRNAHSIVSMPTAVILSIYFEQIFHKLIKVVLLKSKQNIKCPYLTSEYQLKYI